MKIAIVSSNHIPSYFAHSINTVKHANAFSKLGHYVELLTVERSREADLRNEINNIYEWYGIEYLPIKYFKDIELYYWQDNKVYKKVRNIINDLTFKGLRNIFHPEKSMSQYIQENNFDLCYARAYKIVKYNIHKNIPTIIESHEKDPRKNRDLREVIKISNSKYFKGIVTIHNNLKDNFVKLGVPEKKVLVLEDAVDIEKFDELPDNITFHRKKLNIPVDKTVILYSGSLKPGKGIHLILETATQLENIEDLVFYIVGGKEQDVIYWKNYNNRNYRNVVFTGFVHGKNVPQYLKSANILFMPYDKNEKKMVMDINTTSPIKLFEYMAAKKPIITTKLEVIEKVLKHNESAIITDGNYGEEIKLLLANNNLIKKLSINAYQLARKYTYKKRCEKIIEYLY